MVRPRLALVALALAAAAVASPAEARSDHVWVFFRDHGALSRPGPARDRALAEAASRVTPRALARRAKVGDALDDRDLPPDPGYIAAVAARGGIRTTSCWLNAVSVEAPSESL